MYGVIRRYRFMDPSEADALNREVREGFLPIIQRAPGFIGYYWLSNDEGEGLSISIFEDRRGAEESVRMAADYIREHLAGRLSQPEIIQGEVVVHTLRRMPA